MPTADPNLPLPPPHAPSADANAATLRAFIGEAVERASLYAQHATDYAALGDDRGLARSIRMLAICTTQAANTLPRLAAAAERDKAWSEFLRQG